MNGEVRVTTRLLDFDEKRLLATGCITRAGVSVRDYGNHDRACRSGCERKVVPMADHIQAKAAELFAVRRDLPPSRTGRLQH